MRRDAIPTPDLAAPHPPVAHRNSRAMLEAALLALQLREYTIANLAEHLQAHLPGQHLDMVRLVERLVERGELEIDGELLGLTDHGDAAAASIRNRPAPRISPVVLNEQERRISALAPGLLTLGVGGKVSSPAAHLLTRSPRRTAASTADLAEPALRPGALATVELPSRIGNSLHYRDGRITHMDGTVVQAAHRQTDYVPSRNVAERLGYPEKLFSR